MKKYFSWWIIHPTLSSLPKDEKISLPPVWFGWTFRILHTAQLYTDGRVLKGIRKSLCKKFYSSRKQVIKFSAGFIELLSLEEMGQTSPLSFCHVNIHNNGYAIANTQLNFYVQSLSLHGNRFSAQLYKIASNMDVLQQGEVCFSLSACALSRAI